MSDDYTYKVTKRDDYKITVSVVVVAERFNLTKGEVLLELAKDIKLSGFRKGKAPKKDVEAKLGSELINDTLNKLLPDVASEIVVEEKLNPITKLDYELKKVLEDSGIEFEFTFTNYPEVKLGDFGKIKLEEPKVTVETGEIEDVVTKLFAADIEKKEKPTDEEVAKLGIEGVKTMKQLQDQIKERIKQTKASDLSREYEDNILREAIKISKIDIPVSLLKQQTEALIHDYLHQIEHLDVEKEAFLEAQGLTEDKLRVQKEEQAKNRISAELLLNQLAKIHDLFPTTSDIEQELAAITDLELKESLDTDKGRRHIITILTQQRGMRKLVELAQDKDKKKTKKA